MKRSKKHLAFPTFNAVIGALFGAAIGYYVFSMAAGAAVGAIIGFLIGIIIEVLTMRLGSAHWLYRRRVLLTALLEIPLAIMILGPFLYLWFSIQPTPHPLACQPPTSYGTDQYETVQIDTGNDAVLSGWYVPPQASQPGAVIILLHGSWADRCQMSWHARHLLAAGYGILMVDTRATGESTGDHNYGGWFEGEDMLAILDHLESRPEVDLARIGVVGSSGGAHIALNGAYLDPDRIAALWLEGLGPQSIADFPKSETIKERFVTTVNQQILKSVEWYFKIPFPPPYHQILAGLQEPQIFLVTGELEDFERRVNQIYDAAAGENVQLWIVEGGYHCNGPLTQPNEYAWKMLNFFDRALKPAD